MYNRSRTAGLVLVTFAISAGCASVSAETPISANERLVLYSTGSKAHVQVQCLRKEAIQKLTGGQVPDGAPVQSCYEVAIISSDSSNISKAVTSFLGAQDELQSMVPTKNHAPATALGAATVINSTDVAAVARAPFVEGAITSVVTDALLLPPNEALQRAQGLSKALEPSERATVREQLKRITEEPSTTPAARDAVQPLINAF